MHATERSILDRFSSKLKDDVIPCDTLPHLLCLTEDDREQVQHKQDREGPRAAVPLLLGLLKRRPHGFEELLTALECTGCKHLKKLLHDALALESPETTVTTPTEASPSPPPLDLKLPPTPSQESDCSQFPTTPSQNKVCSELPPTPSQNKVCSELPPTPSQNKDCSELPPTPSQNKVCSELPPTPSPVAEFPRKPRTQESDDPEYDIFLCYSPKDRDVAFELRKVMLNEFDLQVCIDELDFVPGNAISNNICDCIRCSKAIVFLLTPDFLEKKWAPWEMQHALLDFLSNRSTPQAKKIVPVMLKECKVPQELQPYTPLNFQESSGATITMESWKRLAAAVHGQRFAGSTTFIGKLSKLFGKN